MVTDNFVRFTGLATPEWSEVVIPITSTSLLKCKFSYKSRPKIKLLFGPKTGPFDFSWILLTRYSAGIYKLLTFVIALVATLFCEGPVLSATLISFTISARVAVPQSWADVTLLISMAIGFKSPILHPAPRSG